MSQSKQHMTTLLNACERFHKEDYFTISWREGAGGGAEIQHWQKVPGGGAESCEEQGQSASLHQGPAFVFNWLSEDWNLKDVRTSDGLRARWPTPVPDTHVHSGALLYVEENKNKMRLGVRRTRWEPLPPSVVTWHGGPSLRNHCDVREAGKWRHLTRL